MFEVYYEEGGALPAELSGKYTREQYAKAAIAKYLNSKGA